MKRDETPKKHLTSCVNIRFDKDELRVNLHGQTSLKHQELIKQIETDSESIMLGPSGHLQSFESYSLHIS